MNARRGTGERVFAFVTAAAFALLTLPRLLTHELWRDEAWLWLVATESRSLGELFGPLSRSGQGYLFPILCFVVARISQSPVAMQLLHLAIATAAVWIFVRWAPLPRVHRVLAMAGYFVFYEYAVLSRHYVLGVLLVWIVLAGLRHSRGVLIAGFAVALLCQTTVYGFVVAAVLSVLVIVTSGINPPSSRRSDFAVAFSVALAGAIAGVVQLIPAEGTIFAPGWRTAWDAAHARSVLSMPWRALVPLPRPGINFWNTNLLDGHPLLPWAGVAAFALAAALLARSRAAITMFLAGSAGLLLFAYVKYLGVMRHQGHLWILFLATLWIAGETATRGWRRHALTTLLIVHAAAGIYASWMDVRHPFSNAESTAALLQDLGVAGEPLLGHREPPAAAVSLPLGKPLYSPSRKLYVRYPHWGPEQREISDEELRCAALELARRENRDIVLVLTHPVSWPDVRQLGQRTGGISASEDFWIYRMAPGEVCATAP